MSELVERKVRDSLAGAASAVIVDVAWQGDLVRHVDARLARHDRRRAAGLVCVATGALIAGLAWVTTESRAEPSPARPPNSTTEVDIGTGRSLAIECRGPVRSAQPTVVIEAAVSGPVSAYAPTVDRLGTEYRVCTYDRAGTGSSDAADRLPRTADDLADDLARLVDAAGLGPSVVLVADESGALGAALLAASRPDLVAGLVLLDPQGPDAAHRQHVSLGRHARNEPPVVTDLRRAFEAGLRSANGEHVDLTASEGQLRAVLESPGPAFAAMPIEVLTPGDRLDRVPALPPELRQYWWQALRDDQSRYAQESSRGTWTEVPGTVGALAGTAPDQVVAAVVRILQSTDG